MIIPPRCFTCGKPLADKWIPFIKIVNDTKNKSDEPLKMNELDIKFINTNSITPDKSVVGDVLDKLDLKDLCCRTIMLSNVHLITSI